MAVEPKLLMVRGSLAPVPFVWDPSTGLEQSKSRPDVPDAASAEE
jgi:hypothetical protein